MVCASKDQAMRVVSVVMATYNGGKFIQQQLQSIYDQNEAVDEIVVSDDGSSDNTMSILQHEAKQGKLKIVTDQYHVGVVENFKRASSASKPGNYIAFADQDDIWIPNKISSSLTLLRHIEVADQPAMVYSDPQVINAKNEVIADSLWEILGYANYKHRLCTILFGNPVGGCSMLINPTLAKEISNIPSDCLMHDAWLALYAFSFGITGIVPDQILKYRQHETNVTFSSNYRKTGRWKRVFQELAKWFGGQDDLFKTQFIFVTQFYETYQSRMSNDVKKEFQSFLSLRDASYIRKKISFRRAMSRASKV